MNSKYPDASMLEVPQPELANSMRCQDEGILSSGPRAMGTKEATVLSLGLISNFIV